MQQPARPPAAGGSNAVAAAASPDGGGSGRRWNGSHSGGGRPEGRTGEGSHRPPAVPSRLWVAGAEGAPPKSVEVRTGISDAGFTELVDAGTLKDDDDVIGGVASASSGSETVNPFAPPRPPGGMRRGMR